MTEQNWIKFKDTEGYNQEEQYLKSTEPMDVFQITNDDFNEQIDTLTPSNVGKWCFLVDGFYQGFCDTEQEAIAAYQEFQKRIEADEII